jgi:hypothetical protein
LAYLFSSSMVDFICEFLKLNDILRNTFEQEAFISNLIANTDITFAWKYFLNIKVLLQGALFDTHLDVIVFKLL